MFSKFFPKISTLTLTSVAFAGVFNYLNRKQKEIQLVLFAIVFVLMFFLTTNFAGEHLNVWYNGVFYVSLFLWVYEFVTSHSFYSYMKSPITNSNLATLMNYYYDKHPHYFKKRTRSN